MIIIEAGGSSTQVCQILEGVKGSISNYDGISPSYMPIEDITTELVKILGDQKTDTDIRYYGTGCSQESAKAIIKNCILSIRNFDQVHIDSDLKAAAIATAREKDGQINIMGTGSSSCLYKNQVIQEVYFNSGYLFGDYGSGFNLGQVFLRAYFENQLNLELEKEIQEFSGVSKQSLVQKIYKTNSPKHFIANFARCMHRLKQDTQVKEILKEAFLKFIRLQIHLNPDYKATPQFFVGSIAHFFHDELSEAMQESKLEIAGVCGTPIEKLIEFNLT